MNASLDRFDNKKANLSLVIIAILSALPLLAGRFPPLEDYPHWVFQHHVIHNVQTYLDTFRLHWAPVPNLGSALTQVVLTPLLGAEQGTRLALFFYAFFFVIAFACLTRTIAARWTAVEFLGPVFTYNFYFYNGYLSYTLGLPFLLFTLAYGISVPPKPTRKNLLILAVLSTLAFLFHLFIWLPVLVYLFVAVFLVRNKKPVLFLSQILPLILLLSYALSRSGEKGFTYQFYTSVTNKLFSLVGPVLPFQRIDPFSGNIPVLLLNLLVILILAVSVLFRPQKLSNLLRRKSVFWTSVVLFLGAMVFPLTWFADMGGADQRLAFSAFLILVALLSVGPWADLSPRLVLSLSLCVLLVHGVIIYRSNLQLRLVYAALQRFPNVSNIIVASFKTPPLYGECNPRLLNTGYGVFPLRAFPIYLALERQQVIPETFDTAIIENNTGGGVTMRFREFLSVQEQDQFLEEVENAPEYQAVFLFGCPERIQITHPVFNFRYRILEEGQYYRLLLRNEQ